MLLNSGNRADQQAELPWRRGSGNTSGHEHQPLRWSWWRPSSQPSQPIWGSWWGRYVQLRSVLLWFMAAFSDFFGFLFYYLVIKVKVFNLGASEQWQVMQSEALGVHTPWMCAVMWNCSKQASLLSVRQLNQYFCLPTWVDRCFSRDYVFWVACSHTQKAPT